MKGDGGQIIYGEGDTECGRNPHLSLPFPQLQLSKGPWRKQSKLRLLQFVMAHGLAFNPSYIPALLQAWGGGGGGEADRYATGGPAVSTGPVASLPGAPLPLASADRRGAPAAPPSSQQALGGSSSQLFTAAAAAAEFCETLRRRCPEFLVRNDKSILEALEEIIRDMDKLAPPAARSKSRVKGAVLGILPRQHLFLRALWFLSVK